jgi:NADPH2:quinone reductase
MRALTAPNATTPLSFVDLPSLPLKPHQVRIAVKAVGVNPVDWKMRDYEFLGVMQRLLGPRGPVVVGIDVAGLVTEVGSKVRDFAVGDRVVGATDFSKGERGSYAEEAIVTDANCARLPDLVSFETAGALPVAGATAWMALHDHGRITERMDPRVLVLGAAGGVGHLAVQLARNAGAKVLGVCSTRNVPLITSFGVTPLDYTQGDALTRARDDGPFDVIVDGVGSATYPRSACASLLKSDGVLVQVVPRASDLPFIALPGRTHTVLGRATRERLEKLLVAIVARRLTVTIEHALPLADAERAQQLSRAGRVVGKLVLVA